MGLWDVLLAPLALLWKKFRHWVRMFLIAVLQCGPIPHHVAFIMDGNRRFAQKKHIPRAEGHRRGFDKLMEVLQWCLDIGVKEVTLYAFSIENFKRSQEEVTALMSLAITKIVEALDDENWFKKHHVVLRFVGDLELLPQKVREAVATAVQRFSEKDMQKGAQCFLNLCFSYTSRNEITDAVNHVVTAVKAGKLEPDDVNENLLEQSLFLGDNPDMLVRTSGEYRFSDFLLWQASYSLFLSTDRLWPALKFIDLFFSILVFQRNYDRVKQRHAEFVDPHPLSPRAQKYIADLQKQRLEQQLALASPHTQEPTPATPLTTVSTA